MENNFLQEWDVSAELRAEGYVEWCVTAAVHVCGEEIPVHRFVVQGRPKRGRSGNRVAPVTAYVGGENEVLVGGKEGWNQGKEFWRETINFWESVH